MKARMAHAYVTALFISEALIFTATLFLHVSLWMQRVNGYGPFAQKLFVSGFVATLITGFLAADRNGFKRLFKSCPMRLRIMIGGVLIYAPIAALLHSVLYPNGAEDPEGLFIVSVVTLALGAISLGIVYVVLWTDAVQGSELIERSRNTCIVAILLGAYLAARYAGFFAPQHRVEMP